MCNDQDSTARCVLKIYSLEKEGKIQNRKHQYKVICKLNLHSEYIGHVEQIEPPVHVVPGNKKGLISQAALFTGSQLEPMKIVQPGKSWHRDYIQC